MLDVTILGAFFAGLLSFLSPCILPMVPFYLSYLAGVSMHEVSTGAGLSAGVRKRAFLAALCFALGVITVFVGLGATASAFGQLVRDYFDVLKWAAAAIIIAMGLHFLGAFKIGVLNRQLRAEGGTVDNVGLAGAFVIGLAFAFGWTPCVGPVLAAILFTAAGQESASEGAVLLFIYGLGMTLPFVAAALFVGPFMSWMKRFRQHLGTVEKLMGVLLIVFGVMIATDTINLLAQWMLENITWFGSIG